MFVVCLSYILMRIDSVLILVRGTIQVLCGIAMFGFVACVDVC